MFLCCLMDFVVGDDIFLRRVLHLLSTQIFFYESLLKNYIPKGFLLRSEKAKEGPTFKGRVKEFCRQKGHGFIIPDHEKNPIFLHISE